MSMPRMREIGWRCGASRSRRIVRPWTAPRAVGALAALALATAIAGAAASAQTPAQTPAHAPARQFASPFLPAGHWAITTVRHLSALGLTDRRFGWGDGSLTQREVARALRDAATSPPPGPPGAARAEFTAIARDAWARFAAEFPATVRALDEGGRTVATRPEGWAMAAFDRHTGVLPTGHTLSKERDDYASPSPLPGIATGVGEVNASTMVTPYLAASITPEWGPDLTVREGYGMAAWRTVGVWGGRRAMAYGPGAGGGLIFNPAVAFDGGGLFLTEPITLPWILRYLGPTRFETFLSRLDSSGAIKHPWVTGSHISIQPHPRVLIGATHASMFGGDSGVAPIRWSTIFDMFHSHGINAGYGEFENGLASVELRYRPPLGTLPVTAYIEWGADDNHSAWILFPGTTAGAELSAVPGLPKMAVGLERTSFAHAPLPNGPNRNYYAVWYRHYLFRDGWSKDRMLIGHPLGGDGLEWLAYAKLDAPERRLQVNVRAFTRERGFYNVYAQTRAGRSAGGDVAAEVRATGQFNAVLNASLEVGRGDWRESSVFGGVRWIF